MRLVLISDTHEQHDKVNLPEGDVLIHAGDYTYNGKGESKSKFFDWFYSQPHKYKIFIAGNHDFKEPECSFCISMDGSTVHYLFEDEVDINGVKFWGSPYTPRFGDWAFMYYRGTKTWDNIPDKVDVVITHGPGKMILDRAFGYGENVGCPQLMDRIIQLKPKLHVFGHIHGSYGQTTFNGTTFANVAICDESYKPTHEPTVIDI